MSGGLSLRFQLRRLFAGLALAAVLTTSAIATPVPIPRPGVPLDSGAGPALPFEDSSSETLGGGETTPLTAASHRSPADILQRSSPAIVTVMSVLPHDGAVRGSGFFVDAHGLIATSHHLIDGASVIKIKTRDGKIYDQVRVLEAKADADLAILEVPGLKVSEPYLPLGDSETVRVGEPIVAIGHPLGLEYTLSSGLVSALRAAEIHGLDLIQFSAPVSPGCSGGPILNGSGQVIGIICLSHPEGQNLNFAIPINYVRQLLARYNKGPALASTMRAVDASPTPLMSHAPVQATAVPAGLDLVPQTPIVTVVAPLARRSFRVGERGFELDCPTSWTCHSQRSIDAITVQMESSDGLIKMDLAAVGVPTTTRLDDFATRVMRGVNATMLSADMEASETVQAPRGPRLVREARQSVGGHDWQMYVHRYQDADGNDDYAVTMLTVTAGRGYMVRYTAPISAWRRVRGAIERIVASAQIF